MPLTLSPAELDRRIADPQSFRRPLLELVETSDGIELWKCGFLLKTYQDRAEAEMMADMHMDYMRSSTEEG